MQKRELRREIRNRLARLSASQKETRAAAITGILTRTSWWREASVVLAFLSMPDEMDTGPLIRAAMEAGKQVGVPRIAGEELVFHRLGGSAARLNAGPYGIPEPAPDLPVISAESIRGRRVLVVTPGLAFDAGLNRLGRGKGFYDRFLGRLRGSGGGGVRAVGVCFSEQLVEQVPVDGHDQPLDGLVTERGVLPAYQNSAD